jgi:hypothetical protein
MPVQMSLRICCCVLAVALFGVLGMQFGVAQESAPGAHDDHKPSGPSKPAPATDGTNTGDIDASISVQPHRPHVRPGQTASVKTNTKPVAGINLRRRVSALHSQIIRNAVGAPVATHAEMERRDAVHVGAPVGGHGAVGPTGTAAVAADHLPKTEDRIERPVTNTNAIVLRTAPNRGTINGSGLTRRTVGPATLGGPTTTIAGINGTTIRPKH